ncbi:hypothetical protein EV401DRAFT_1185807 [Pisolithus croceorrhizus]|nr:hypothetical protein EV401DRAFT_1185807 [Pisolithus croceorrhizus]
MCMYMATTMIYAFLALLLHVVQLYDANTETAARVTQCTYIVFMLPRRFNCPREPMSSDGGNDNPTTECVITLTTTVELQGSSGLPITVHHITTLLPHYLEGQRRGRIRAMFSSARFNVEIQRPLPSLAICRP